MSRPIFPSKDKCDSYYHHTLSMATPATVRFDGVEYPPLGRGEYDVIIFGVGFRECLLASLLIKANKNVESVRWI